jgi:hypothetical protein
MSDNMRVLVAGLGNIGIPHALAYQKLDGFEIVGIKVWVGRFGGGDWASRRLTWRLRRATRPAYRSWRTLTFRRRAVLKCLTSCAPVALRPPVPQRAG